MSTTSVSEKKGKKMAKKVSEPAPIKVEVKEVEVSEPAPINELSQTSGNDTFFELFDMINEKMTELQSTLSNVNVSTIDAKKLMDTRKKFDKSIMSFNAQTMDLYISSLKTATKNSTKKTKKVSEGGAAKDSSAVKQKLKAKKCLHEFLGKDNFDEEFSRNDAYTGVTSFIRELRQNDPASIAVENGTNKEFKVVGKLSTFISGINAIVKDKIKIVEKEIKNCESKKPAADTKEAREIENLKGELEKFKLKTSVPKKMAFTDIMGYTNHCFVMSNEDIITKAKATKPKVKK